MEGKKKCKIQIRVRREDLDIEEEIERIGKKRREIGEIVKFKGI